MSGRNLRCQPVTLVTFVVLWHWRPRSSTRLPSYCSQVDGLVGADSLNPEGFNYPQPHDFQQANYPYEAFAPTQASSPGASGMEHSVTSFSCHDMKAGSPTDGLTCRRSPQSGGIPE